MGYRGCQPTSPASRWLRCQDNAASDSHADAMECCSPQQEYRHSTSEHVKEGLILQDEDGVSGLNAAVSINQSIDTASPRALRTLLRMMVHSQPKCRDLADAFFSHSQSNNDTPSRKRKSRETCQNCNIEFDPFDMVNQKCNYHPGESVQCSASHEYPDTIFKVDRKSRRSRMSSTLDGQNLVG